MDLEGARYIIRLTPYNFRLTKGAYKQTGRQFVNGIIAFRMRMRQISQKTI